MKNTSNNNGKLGVKDTVSLKEYFDTRLKSLEVNLTAQLTSLKEATSLAKEGMDERLQRMNEFRESLKDQASTFVTKTELNRICDSISDLKESRAELKGKADQSQLNFTMMLSAAGTAIAVFSIILRFLVK